MFTSPSRSLLFFAVAMWFALTVSLGTPRLAWAASASKRASEKVLGLKIEGVDLSDKDKKDLFRVLQTRLRAYPNIQLVQPPEGELIDQMIDLECVDADVDCLARLGATRGATRVFYAQVDAMKSGYEMRVLLVAVGSAKALYQERRKVRRRAKLPSALEAVVREAFGPPPKDKPKKGKLIVEVSPGGAKIYINGDYRGVGRVERQKIAPGTYNVRVTRPGYQEEFFQVEVVAGETAKRKVNLQVLPGPPVRVEPAPVSVQLDEASFYKKWWFWTSVGAVAVATTLVAVMASGAEQPSTGGVILSVDGVDAWKDSAILEARGEP